MTESVCGCPFTKQNKNEYKTKEKLRLFSRKKSLNKNVCSKCGFPFPAICEESGSSDRPPPTPKYSSQQHEYASAVYEPTTGNGTKKVRRQSEELPDIPKDNAYYQSAANPDSIYTEIADLPLTNQNLARIKIPPPIGYSDRKPPYGPQGYVGGGPQRYGPPGSRYEDDLYCDCSKCRRERGHEPPMTVELLPMDTQVTLQSMMNGSTLMCNII